MLELRTLGTVGVQTAGEQPAELLRIQPKRLALLAFLALADSGHFRRRDTIVSLFWPESDQEHARAALRQSLRGLRRTLGEDVLVSHGEEVVGLASEKLWCDATAFLGASDAGDFDTALQLYRGDFLEGLFVSDGAAELEQWTDGVRSDLRRRAVAAAAWLSQSAERAGDLSVASARARQALAFEPDDEPSLRRLVTLLDRMGERPAAIRVYEEFSARLATELDAQPSPETIALATALRNRPATVSGAVLGAASAVEPPVRSVSGESIPHPVAAPASPRAVDRRRFLVPVTMLGTVTLVAAMLLARRPPLATPVDARVVAVLPFRIDGADSALSYLSEGMVDLLAMKLTGEGGPRAADPRSTMSAWRSSDAADVDAPGPDAARQAALRLGAGRMIDGAIVGTPNHLTLSASLISLPGGETVTRAAVTGTSDSLATMVDRLALDLMAGEAGGSERNLSALASMPALQAYLAGQAAYRLGQWSQATERFNRALQLDSTFALAAMGLASAALWVPNHIDLARGQRLAWAARDRLEPRDRAYLTAKFMAMTTGDRLQLWEQVVTAMPDRPDAWYELGDLHLHWGAMLGVDSPTVRAASAFERALALDSSAVGHHILAEAVTHQIEIATSRRDSLTVQRLTKVARSLDPGLGWLVAQSSGDSLALDSLRARFSEMDIGSLLSLSLLTQQNHLAAADAERIAEAMGRRAVSRTERSLAAITKVSVALNGGRPVRALAASSELPDIIRGHQFDFWDRRTVPVYAALYWEGDSAAGARAASELAWFTEAPPATEPRALTRQYTALCAVEQWRLQHGDTRTTARTIQRLTSGARAILPGGTTWVGPGADTLETVAFTRGCASLLAAWLAVVQKSPEAGAALRQADSLTTAGAIDWLSLLYENLVLARLHELQGDLRSALAATRRRVTFCCSVAFLSSYLREEGRLAALTGDRQGAVRAYRHYLSLRANHEAELRPEVQRVRRELAGLLSEQP